MQKEFTLRNMIEEAKEREIARCGVLDWRWTDESLIYAILDYHSSKGSVMDFTRDDWQACRDNGFSLSEVVSFICDEPWFDENVEDFDVYINMCKEDWKQRNSKWMIDDASIPQDVILGFTSDFYTWRVNCLPMVKEVFAN